MNFGDYISNFDEMAWFSNYPTRYGFVSNSDYLVQIFLKNSYPILMFIIPCFYHGFLEYFGVWLISFVVFSYGYALFFAVNHWTDDAE